MQIVKKCENQIPACNRDLRPKFTLPSPAVHHTWSRRGHSLTLAFVHKVEPINTAPATFAGTETVVSCNLPSKNDRV